MQQSELPCALRLGQGPCVSLARKGAEVREEEARVNPDAVFAAIDLGTNACRLLMAVPDGDGVRIIGSYSASVRLGEGLVAEGALSEAALSRTLAALKECKAHMHRRGVTHVKAIATEACRRASNAEAMIARARDEAGIDLIIVTAAEEAQLAAAGCADLIGDGYDGALVFDIGGGSTELIMVRAGARPEVVTWCSLPIGVVSLAEGHGGRRLSAAAFAPMRSETEAALARERSKLGNGFDAARFHLLGTSGTLTTLAGAKLGLSRYERRRIDGQWLERDEVLSLVERIAASDFEARASIPCIGADRADLILPGVAILSVIMETWPCARLRVADRGLREGLLAQLLDETRA